VVVSRTGGVAHWRTVTAPRTPVMVAIAYAL